MATVEDVASNPKRLKFVPIEGSQSARSFDDVTASVTYTTFAKQAGLSEQDSLGFDNNSPDAIRRYAIRWVTTPERANDPRLLKFIAIRLARGQATLRRLYGDLIDFLWRGAAGQPRPGLLASNKSPACAGARGSWQSLSART